MARQFATQYKALHSAITVLINIALQHATKYEITNCQKLFTFSSDTVSREKSVTNFNIDCSCFSRNRRTSTDKRYRLTTVLSLQLNKQSQHTSSLIYNLSEKKSKFSFP